MKSSRRAFIIGSAGVATLLSRSTGGATLAASSRSNPDDQDYFPPPDTEGGWRAVAEPDSVRKAAGIDLGRLDRAFAYAKATSKHGGLLVVRHGWLAYERYFGRANREV